MRTRVLLTAAVAVALLLAGFLAVRLLQEPRSRLQEAVTLAPAQSQRWTFTDWAAVREEVGAGSPEGNLAELLDAGFEADLTSASGLLESAALLDQEFGWSPANVEWELLAQSSEGAVEIVSLGTVPVESVTDRLEALGYQRPAEPDGVWVGGTDLLATLSARTGLTGTPTLQHLAVRDGIVWASDREAYLESALDSAGDDSVPDGISAVVSGLADDPVSAVVHTGAQGCEALRMGQADETDQAAGDQLVERAGELNPYTAIAMALLPGDRAEVLMAFEGDDQARTNAETRAVLAAGPAPGQGGSFTDRFAVEEVAAEGSLVRMTLAPAPGAYLLSDLSSGPVLFASC